jgi:aromatic ring-opening dioxygenase catalytic subunit (LigB family)
MPKMPTVYFPHGGGPCFFMEWDPPETWNNLEAYLRRLPDDIGQKPQSILMISAHWEGAVVQIQGQSAPELLFDYSGFPDHTYELTYPAPGSPALAASVVELLSDAGHRVETVTDRGFDHGMFVPLKVAWPEANIPVVQLSLRADLDPAAHIAMGEALQPLREESVLIIGSGFSYHNVRASGAFMRSGGKAEFGDDFNTWLVEATTSPDHAVRNQALVDWVTAPMARDAHPREEHLLPLHVVAGAAGSDQGRQTFETRIMGFVSSAIQFG